MNLPADFSKVKVLVVGDVMLDRYWWGQVERISPEAPVPVVRMASRSYSPGGAANVAANITGLGANVFLIGCIGKDAEAGELVDAVTASGVDAGHLIAAEQRPTTVKTRIVAHSQHIVRVDNEDSAEVNGELEAELIGTVDDLLPLSDVVVISDYAKGLLTKRLLSHIFRSAETHGKKVIVDPKGIDYSRYRGATLLTPNQKEAAEACNLETKDNDLVAKAAEKLINELGLEVLLITQGENGMTLIKKDGTRTHLPAVTKQIYDVTGAGDTVVASLAVGIGAGLGYEKAASIANVAAGIAVGRVGTTTVTSEMLADTLKRIDI